MTVKTNSSWKAAMHTVGLCMRKEILINFRIRLAVSNCLETLTQLLK